MLYNSIAILFIATRCSCHLLSDEYCINQCCQAYEHVRICTNFEITVRTQRKQMFVQKFVKKLRKLKFFEIIIDIL